MVRSVACALLVASLTLTPDRSAGGETLTVVELFTSQGCSSCPPADALIGELAQRDDVLALSQHVDYWDYLGWKDPFSLSAATQRQRDYARHLGLGYVYTPQIVIDGVDQVAGSNRDAVLALLQRPASQAAVDVKLSRTADGGIAISVGGARVDEGATVWLVMFDREHTTRVSRGENRGREMRNYNVVRSITLAGRWNGDTETITAVVPDNGELGDACAVIVQTRDSGRILGAARLDLTSN